MKLIIALLLAFSSGLLSIKFYYQAQEGEKRISFHLKRKELISEMEKIETTLKNDGGSLRRDSKNSFEILANINLTSRDRAVIGKFKNDSATLEMASAILLSSYSGQVSDSEYDSRIKLFKESLSRNPDASFKSALKLLEDSEFTEHPLRKASALMIVTSIPGKHIEGIELALNESRINVDIEELNEQGLTKDQKYEYMLVPIIALESALNTMKENGIEPYEATLKTLESQSNLDIRRGMIEKFESSFPELKGKIQI